MSEATRKAISDAANFTEGVVCTPYYRQTTKPGEAFVRLSQTNYPDQFGGIDTWQVLVILPTDIATAEQRLEVLGPELVKNLSPELLVKRLIPQEVVFDNGPKVPCVVIEGNRESD